MNKKSFVRNRIIKKIVPLFIVFVIISLLLSGCSTTENKSNPINDFLASIGLVKIESEQAANNASVLKSTSLPVNETPEMQQSSALEIMTPTPIPTPTSYMIELWVPPAFDISQNNEAGKSLESIINQYTKDHPNVNITVRVKATAGESSMLNTITAANHVAKDVLPSLALISRSDMETAAQRGLLQPIDTSIFSDSNSWYGYAGQSALIDSIIYGIPVLGDGWTLAYKPAKIGPELGDWHDILSRGLPIGFAPSSSTSMFGLFIYLSIGGKIINEQGQPYLDQQKLVETLNFFLSGGQNGVFPPSIAQLVDQSQVWQRFNDGTMTMIISQFSSFRRYQNSEISVRTLPLAEGIAEYPLVTTWNLVMIEDNPILQPEVVRFAEYLGEQSVNEKLTADSGYLPVRRGDHNSWASDPQYQTVLAMCESSALVPNNQVVNKIVPLINNAVLQVIKNQISPEDAASEALSNL